MRRFILIMLLVVLEMPTAGRAQEIAIPCPPQAIAALPVGSQAGVTYSQSVYAEPNAAAPIGSVPANVVVTIAAAPVCFENTEWWKIAYNGTNLSGWIPLYFRRYNPDGGISLGSDPGLLPYQEVAGFERRDMPADAALALGFSTGGAMGGFLHDENCLGTSRLYDQLDSIAGQDIFGTYDSCDEEQPPSPIIDSGDTVHVLTADMSITWWYWENHVPAICYQSAETLVALSPDGEEMDISAPDHHPCRDIGYEVAQLPLAAYHQPGVWQLRVDDYSINIEVTIPEFPIFSHYVDADGLYTVWLGGFDPDERVVIFIGSPSSGSGAAPFRQIYEIQTDADGYFVGSLPDQGEIFVAVGEKGNVHWKGRCEGDIYVEEDPNAACAEQLYEYFWSESDDE